MCHLLILNVNVNFAIISNDLQQSKNHVKIWLCVKKWVENIQAVTVVCKKVHKIGLYGVKWP